jgi:cyclopropane fatty-acyl-phospholipid synthase-like methyltransferase
MTEKPAASRDADYFNRIYARNSDPWGFTSSDYERRKYDATIAALGGRRFASAIEVGCSIGVLTARLAAHCEKLLGIDFAPAALAEAKQRCAVLPNVQLEVRGVPQDWPNERFDLIVFSEVLYFLTPEDNARTAARACESILPGGVVLLVNFTEQIDEPVGGAQAAELFTKNGAACLSLRDRIVGDRFRIDLLQAR